MALWPPVSRQEKASCPEQATRVSQKQKVAPIWPHWELMSKAFFRGCSEFYGGGTSWSLSTFCGHRPVHNANFFSLMPIFAAVGFCSFSFDLHLATNKIITASGHMTVCHTHTTDLFTSFLPSPLYPALPAMRICSLHPLLSRHTCILQLSD